MTTKTLDTSDIDQYLGKPMDSSPIREPIANNDIRRWVHAMHYPNRLHYDPAFSSESRWEGLIAPQSFAIAVDDGHGAGPACVGCIPDSHLLFGGDEWWFGDEPVVSGDYIYNERIPFDYKVKETGFAGPTCFQRGDNIYTNQDGKFIAKQRSTAIRYLANAGKDSVQTQDFEEPVWSKKELESLADRKFQWIDMLHKLGHQARLWDDVNVGDVLPERVFGPHSIASFTTEWRAYLVNTWGTLNLRKHDLAALGFTEEMAGFENDPDVQLVNPELTDGAYFGPSRGHLFPQWAREIGMPRAYGYGASMGAWVTDYLAGWAGEHGRVVHSNAAYRAPALSGDITIQNGEIVDKFVDENGRKLVQIKHTMSNQRDQVLCTALAEVALA